MSGALSRASRDRIFIALLAMLGGAYIALIVALLAADLRYTSLDHVLATLSKREIRASIGLTLVCCTISAILSIWIALPLGYLLSRCRFPGRAFVDTLLEAPLVLPPLVLGLSLLILFNVPLLGEVSLERWLQRHLGFSITYSAPAVVLAQFSVAAAFAVRTLRGTFDQIHPRTELVAMTLGCSRAQAFVRVTLPQAWRGIVTAAIVAWARSLGEFGPILVFAGATRMKTEVLSTTVFLELSTGSLEAAVAVSLVMVAAAMAILLSVRLLSFGART